MTRLFVWITAGLTGIIGLLIGIIINGSQAPARTATLESASRPALVDDVKVDVLGLPAPGLGFVIYFERGRLACLEGFLWGDGDTSILDLNDLTFTIRPLHQT